MLGVWGLLMSGVFGVVGLGGGGVGGVLGLMGDAGSHRGPDGMGVWVDEDVGVGLGCLELWVSPESEGETGPWEGGDLVVASDARLDNRSDLIRMLGVESSISDRALIGEAYRTWGGDCVDHLLGDFAFVVYDSNQRRIFAARDAMGMRPLYYRYQSGRLWFASEVKQILSAPGVPNRIFEPAVAGYLAGGVTRLEWSFYEGIDQLPPAHALTVDHNGPRTRRYWDIDPEHQIRYDKESDYAEHFRELFIEAVRTRVRTNHPVGIFLSGGVDSGSIASVVGWLQQQGQGPDTFHAYTWAFNELPQCDERHLSRLITNHYHIPTTDIPADNAYPLANYPQHTPDQDEPFLGAYQPLIDNALHTAQTHHTRTILSGDRGDLVCGGFVIDYPAMVLGGLWTELQQELTVHHHTSGDSYGRIVLDYLVRPAISRARRIGMTGAWRRVRRGQESPIDSPDTVPDWALIDFDDAFVEAPAAPTLGPFDLITQTERYEWVFLPFQMHGMVWSNRSYARFGQSFADPWSDRRIAAFALAVPQQTLNRPGQLDKRLPRAALKGVMPEPFRIGARKILPTPLFDLAMSSRAVSTITSLVERPVAAERGWVDSRAWTSHYESYLNGDPLDPRFWWSLTVEMWLRGHEKAFRP